jgi:Rab9 effector protein with kelch motifs
MVPANLHDRGRFLRRDARTQRCCTRTRSGSFGGGNGLHALNDVWTLDRMRWERVAIADRKRPSPRGYHTANLVRNIIFVVGVSDGRECFQNIWCLNLVCLRFAVLHHPSAVTDTAAVGLDTNKSKDAAPASIAFVGTSTYPFISGAHDGAVYTPELPTSSTVGSLFSLPHHPSSLMRGPSVRHYYASLLADSRLFLFGGFNGYDVFDDVHVPDFAASYNSPNHKF